MTRLIEKLQKVEKLLRNNPSISFQKLFEEISPILGKYYRKLRLEFNDPEEALNALWGEKKNNIDYSYLSSLLDLEEIESLAPDNLLSPLDNQTLPEMFFKEWRNLLLTSGESPLDRFIRRHNQRKNENSLNLQEVLRELQLLVQEGLTDSHFIQDIVDFSHSLSKIIDKSHAIISLLSSLPHPELKWLFTLEKYFLRIDCPFPKELVPFSVMVDGAFMKQRRFALTESENQYLFDKKENLNKNPSLTGRSNVTYFPEKHPEFYLKQYPEWPGYELASTMFLRLLGVTRLPYQDLIIINNYPVLLTQKVNGNPVHKVWDDPQTFENLDPVHTGLLIISAMLINPEDGKEDNFILSPDGRFLVPIDNDHCFLPSTLQKEGNFWNAFTVNTALQTKTLLFCLEEMYRPFPLEVKQQILSINFDERIPQWMAELDKIENKLSNLVDPTQRNSFLERGTIMRIPFYKQFVQSLHWKVHKIQALFKTVFQLTPIDLLKAIEPFAAKCYYDSFQKGSDLQARFKAATDQLYTTTSIDGSRVSILNTRTMMEIINISEKDLQKDATFQRMGPIDAFEFLNQLIQERSERVQIEQELLCELDEDSQEKKWISLFGNPLMETALKAFFANPTEALVLKGSKLFTTSKLTDLFAKSPEKGMKIRFLSLPNSPVLTKKEIRLLATECPNIEYLNVSGCSKLIEIITADGEWPLLARLEAKNCFNLKKLVSYSPMKILRIETNQEIEVVVEKLTLDIFIISKKTTQFEFSFSKADGFRIRSQERTLHHENFVKEFIFQKKRVEEYFNDVKILMGTHLLSSGEGLERFVTIANLQNSDIHIEGLEKMVQLNLLKLKKLDLSQNQIVGKDSLEYLIQGNWPQLNHLNLSNNRISDEGFEVLARGSWPLLEFLNLQNTRITTVGVEAIVKKAKWMQLKLLNLSSNLGINDRGLAILSQGDWQLEILNLNNTQILKKTLFYFILDTKWLNLKEVNFDSLGENTAKNLLQNNWHLLESLDLSRSEITKSEIKVLVNRCKWPQFKSLNLSYNEEIDDQGLEILSQGNWPLIESLWLDNTQITIKGLFHFLLKTNWLNLKEIDFSWGEKSFAESLLPINWPRLKKLDLMKREITIKEIELIVEKSNWPQLKHLNLYGNPEIGDKEVELLAQAKWPLLEALNLGQTKITGKGVEAIVNRAKWTQLKSLDIAYNAEISDDTLAVFAQASWPLLETLNLRDTKVTKKGILGFVLNINWPNLKKIEFLLGEEKNFAESLLPSNWLLLEKVNLPLSKITRKEIELIIEKSNWPQLKHLNLYGNPGIGDKELELLSHAKWPLLETLNLRRTKITGKGIEATVFGAQWTQLKSLDIAYNAEISDDTLAVLAQASWPLLEILDLGGSGVTKKGVLNFVLSINSPNLKRIEFLRGSKQEFAESLLPRKWPLLEMLDLRQSRISKNDVRLMVEKSNWPQLKHLDLSKNAEIGDKEVELLAHANWPLLDTLNLGQTKVTSKGVEVIVNGAQWYQLNSLDISDNVQINDEILPILARASWDLEILNLKGTRITKKGILNLVLDSDWPNLQEISCNDDEKNFAGSLLPRNWPRLEKLDLEQSGIAEKEIELIVQKSNWPQLKHLNLDGNTEIGDKELQILAHANWLHLESLNLGQTKITARGIVLIIFRAQWTKLKSLNISRNAEINDDALAVLAHVNWPLLETLDLGETEVTKKGILSFVLKGSLRNLKEIKFPHGKERKFAENLLPKNWPQLKILDLQQSRIAENDIELIIKRSDWPQLKHLNLYGNTEIYDTGLELLAHAKWPLLESLNLGETNITSKGIMLIVFKAQWTQLKSLNISHNAEINDGTLAVLVQANWPLLETLDLRDTRVTKKGILNFVLNVNWSNLKQIEFFYGSEKKFTESLLPRNWPLLEKLDLSQSGITEKEIELIVEKSNWPQLKNLDVSMNSEINDNILQIIAQANWSLLETLDLRSTRVTKKGTLNLVLKSDWPKLQEIYFNENDKNFVGSLLRRNWPQLEILDLKQSGITEKEIEFIVEKSNWPKLKHLNLSHNSEIGDKELELLAHVNWPLLETLNLRQTKITRKGFKLIVSEAQWTQLRSLNISHNVEINDGTLEVLVQANWPLLETLDLRDTRVTKKGILNFVLDVNWSKLKEIKFLRGDEEKFAESLSPRNWPQLEILDLKQSRITGKDIEFIVEKSNWPKLKCLNLYGNTEIGDKDLELLAQENWFLLERLDLGRTGVTKKGVLNFVLNINSPNLKRIEFLRGNEKKFAESLLPRNWPRLETLDLRQGRITEKEIEFIMKKSNWPQLKHLDLSQNAEIGDKELKLLVQANWPLLETLNLRQTNITGKGVEVIVNRAQWIQLKFLDIAYNAEINDNTLAVLAQANWPLLEILDLGGSGVTKKGILNLVLNTNWSNLQEIHFNENKKNFVGSLLPKNWLHLEKLDLRQSRISKNDVRLMVEKSNWPQLKHLDLSKNYEIGNKELELLAHANWPLLETLNLGQTKVTSKGVEVIVHGAQWNQLKSLDISDNVQINDEILPILARASWDLEILNLKGTGVTKRGILSLVLNINWSNLQEIHFNEDEKNFVGSLLPRNWPRLENLNLSSSKSTHNEIKLIAEKSNWPQLKHLDLSNTEIGDKDLELLVQANWPLLETLDLRDTRVTKKGVLNLILNINWLNLKQIYLFRWSQTNFSENLLPKNWSRLETVDLQDYKIAPNEIKAIVEKCKFPKLKHLDLSWNSGINDEALAILSRGEWPLLETLNLKQTGLTKKGILNLALKINWPNLKKIDSNENEKNFVESLLPRNWILLEKVNLSWSKITRKEIELIIQEANWPKLKHLNLDGNPEIGDKELELLAQANWTLLETLNLRRTKITGKGIEAIIFRAQWMQLKSLNISDNAEINDLTLPILAQANWYLLEILDLRETGVTKRGVLNFVLNINLTNLKQIELIHCCEENFAESLLPKNWPRLKKFYLRQSEITQKEIELIVEKSNWPQLKHLNLSNNFICDEGVSALTGAKWILLENLNLNNTKLSTTGVEKIVHQSKWPQSLKYLNVSNNDIFDEGLSALALAEWPHLEELYLKNIKITFQGVETLVNKMLLPNLKKLNISENSIFDLGLEILTSGKWPLFQHLVYYDTKVTINGHITLLKNLQWPDFHQLEHSLNESLFNFEPRQRDFVPSEVIRAAVPMYCNTSQSNEQAFLVLALDVNWWNSKDLYLSINHGSVTEKIIIMPHDKWDQLESILLSFYYEQSIKLPSSFMWPSNLKILNVTYDLFDDEFADENKLESLFTQKCPLLEELYLPRAGITVKGIEVLVKKSDWPNLKKLDLSENNIQNEGLIILSSGKWPLLECLFLNKTKIRLNNLEAFVKKALWPNLKELHLTGNTGHSENAIVQEMLSRKWPNIKLAL